MNVDTFVPNMIKIQDCQLQAL